MEGSQLGNYRIVRLIGRGGMGAVYEAHNPVIKRRVAIKQLLPEFTKRDDVVRRFHNEAVAVNAINHPGVVQVSEVGKAQDGSLYLVMEFLEGETLADRLQRSGNKLPEEVTTTISWQLAGVLAAAHTKSIVHRDIKPGNIMLVPDMAGPDGERVKLLDFGIAKLGIEHDPSPDGPTRTGQIFGTTAYMSPEQFMNGKPVDGQSDVYSLGAMMYRMLAGRLPFTSEKGEMALAAMHMFELPQPLQKLAPWVSPWLGELVDQMLRKDPGQRPTMAQVAAQLQEHLPFRAPSRSSIPQASSSSSGNVATVAPSVGLALTAADNHLPFLAPPPRSAPSAGGALAETVGQSPAAGAEDSQPPSLNLINGQLAGSALGGLLRRPLLVAVSFGLLGAGIGGGFVLRALRPAVAADRLLVPASAPVATSAAAPATPTAGTPAAAPATPTAGTPAPAAPEPVVKPSSKAGPSPGPSAGPGRERRSHKPAPRVRSSKRKDWKKDGTPPSAATPHPTLLDD